MENKDVTKKNFPSFDDLFGKKDIVVEGDVEEMQLEELGYEIAGDNQKDKKEEKDDKKDNRSK
jgi:hypothetical protein